MPKAKSSHKNKKRKATTIKAEPEIVSDQIENSDPVVEVLPSDEPEGSSQSEQPDRPSKKIKDVVVYDPYRAYLREMQQYPPLSREEEKALAIRFREHGDREAAYKLVVSNLRLVLMIAKEYQKAARSLMDLVQEGNIGLMEAVKNFDPYRNVRFPSYAVWWVKAYIIRYIIANWRLVKIGTTQAQRKLFFNLQKEKEKLEKEGFYPATKLLAERLDVKESELIEMEQRLSSPDVSVDAPLGASESDNTMHSILPANNESIEELIGKQQVNRLIHDSFDEFAEQLNDRESVIFRKRMLAEKKATLHEIAEQFSLSKERVRQIENKLKQRLKTFMTEKFGNSLDSLELN